MIEHPKEKNSYIEHVKCVWGLLCSLSSIDQERNNLSLFNIIDQFNIPADFFIQQKSEKKTLLFMHPYEIILLLRRTLDIGIADEEIAADIKIITIDPDGKNLQEILSPIKFPKGIRRLRFRITMQGLLASMAGDYVHQIEIKWTNQDEFKKVLEIPFEVREQKKSLS